MRPLVLLWVSIFSILSFFFSFPFSFLSFLFFSFLFFSFLFFLFLLFLSPHSLFLFLFPILFFPPPPTFYNIFSSLPTKRCSLENHQPATCSIVKMWLKKCADDSETANWISCNTKECPKCHATIEKNGGCNHMQCKVLFLSPPS